MENSRNASYLLDIAVDTFHVRRHSQDPAFIKKQDGRIYIDINNYDSVKLGDPNSKRHWAFNRMFDNIYFALAKYLNDSEISKLMMALGSDSTEASWSSYFSKYSIKMNNRALFFIEHGKKILNTEALYINYDAKDDYTLEY